MWNKLVRSCSLPLALLCGFAPELAAQNCASTISANVATVSVTAGGTQLIDVSVLPSQSQWEWQVVGAFGTNNPSPWFAYGGLRLNFDRYTLRMFNGHKGFVQGVVPGYFGGPLIPFDAQGNAQIQVVIPPGLSSAFIGRTLHHGFYHTSPLSLLPECGSGTVSLTFLP